MGKILGMGHHRDMVAHNMASLRLISPCTILFKMAGKKGCMANGGVLCVFGINDIYYPVCGRVAALGVFQVKRVLSLRGVAEAISMEKYYYIYIMTNKNNKVLYTGVTSDLKRRVYEHKEKLIEGFTKRYNITKLSYYEIYRDAEKAILREKQIKGGSRAKKEMLVNGFNPEWRDLYTEL